DGSKCGGSCDGTLRAACAYPGAGASCRDASCDTGVATLGAFCDGKGACPKAFQQTCDSGKCDGTGCGHDCSVDKDCALNEFCSAGQCVQKQPTGASCPSASACASGVCVDGFCCNNACNGQCQACDVAGKEGICTAVAGKPHGARAPCTAGTRA